MKTSNKLIYFFISLSTILIIINFYNFVLERSPVQYSDWLINYQGGFVRRGLIGEFFYRVYTFFNIPLDIVVLFFVSLFYLFFAFFFIKILKKISFNLTNTLIIFSPLSFLYPFMDQKVSGRKDIMFILSILILCFFLEKIKFQHQKYLVISLILITTFSHSGFFVYIPLFLLIFFIINHNENFLRILRELIIIGFGATTLFVLIMFNTSVSDSSIIDICNSISEYLPRCGNSDYIETLNWSMQYEIQLVNQIWNKQNYISFYFIAFLIANFPLMYVLFYSKIEKKKLSNINPLFIFILINIFTLPIYYIGADYGRYMYLSYLSLSIIYFKSLSSNFLTPQIKLRNINKYFAVLIIFLFSFTWTIPHCCGNNFKFIYKKPISKIFGYN